MERCEEMKKCGMRVRERKHCKYVEKKKNPNPGVRASEMNDPSVVVKAENVSTFQQLQIIKY